MSLKNQIIDYLKLNGYISYDNLEMFCRNGRFGKMIKLNNAERRLRELTDPKHHAYNPDIVKDEANGIIKGYKHLKPMQFRNAYVKDSDGNVIKTIRIPV